jgi:hypothetical protein
VCRSTSWRDFQKSHNTSNLTGLAFYRICNIYGQTKAAEVWTLTLSSFPSGPKYFSQQSGFEHSQLVQFAQHGSPSITPIRNNRENYSVLYFNTYVCRQVMGKKVLNKWYQSFTLFNLLLISSIIEILFNVVPRCVKFSHSFKRLVELCLCCEFVLNCDGWCKRKSN